jgi:hypothetical protein
MHRRSFVLAVAGMTAFAGKRVLAQEATPVAGSLAGYGLPAIRVTAGEATFEGVPAELAAGRYLLSLEQGAGSEGGIGFLQLPDGMDLAGFEEVLETADEPPDWYFTAEQAGGLGSPGLAVIDLTPGTWIGWGDDPMSPLRPVEVVVTGDAAATPGTGSDIAADVTVTMFEFDFSVEGSFRAGRQVIEVVNVGAQPHFLLALRSDVPITNEQVERLLDLDMSGGTPEPGEMLPNPDEMELSLYVPTLSTGRRQWVEADLGQGWHALLCFVPDLVSGAPHAMLGMYEVIVIGGGPGTATPTA